MFTTTIGPLVLATAIAAAPVPQSTQANPFGRQYPPRIYTTQKLDGPPPSIDGELDDAAWQQGAWSGDYTQQMPTEGARPSQPTELKVLYDERNVYVAIRAYDDPAQVHRYPSRRDDLAGDILGICFDSYFDKRSGFEFDLTAAGTKIDLVLSNEGWDTSWDAVWYGKVAHGEDAWTAEFQIPLSQLRYGPQQEQIWGMHAWRWIDRNQEEDQWNLIPRNSTGRMYNLGELHGIRGLPRSRHVELLPHTVASLDAEPGVPGDPYRTGARGIGAAGVDAKLGLTSNFTLDATVNPDFGQVEADPSVVNLTSYETFFEEKRPFFIEGKRILSLTLDATAAPGDTGNDVTGDMLFYSRRIGQPPRYQPSLGPDESMRMPDSTSILMAAKVTGKTRTGLSVGILDSITGSEQARVTSHTIERRIPVEPAAHYFVGRMQKDWDKGNTMVGGMLTSTNRWLPGDGLRFLPGTALSGAVDFARFFHNRSYVFEGKGILSRIAGDPEAIRALETNPVHNFQRPDAAHLHLRDRAASLSGHAGTVRIARYGNSKWRWSETVRWVSPGLDLNDVGYLRQADFTRNTASIGFVQTDPGRLVRTYAITVSRQDAWDFGGLRTDGTSSVEGDVVFANKWRAAANAHVVDRIVDTRLLRGGPAMRLSPFTSLFLSVQTDPSRRATGTISGHVHLGAEGGSRAHVLASSIDMKVSRAFTASAQAEYQGNTDDLQYVATAGTDSTPRYLLGHLRQRTLALTFRAGLQLSPDLSVQYYGSPFVSTGRYAGLKRASTTPLAGDYGDRFRLFGPGEIAYQPEDNSYAIVEGAEAYRLGNPDFSFRQFRSNLVARWELTPGSSLYVVWSQGRTSALDRWDDSVGHNFDALWQTPARNILLVKFSYWLPI